MWTNENRARYDRSRLRYPSDLTDDEWKLVEPLIPPGRRGGDKRTVILREVVNGLMYILSTGCQWRAIPKDLPPRSTLYALSGRNSANGSSGGWANPRSLRRSIGPASPFRRPTSRFLRDRRAKHRSNNRRPPPQRNLDRRSKYAEAPLLRGPPKPTSRGKAATSIFEPPFRTSAQLPRNGSATRPGSCRKRPRQVSWIRSPHRRRYPS